MGIIRWARDFILYRERHAASRPVTAPAAMSGYVLNADGSRSAYATPRLRNSLAALCADLPGVNLMLMCTEIEAGLYDGITSADLLQSQIMTARGHTEEHPDYDRLCARLRLQILRREALGLLGLDADLTDAELYPAYLPKYIAYGVEHELLDPRLAEFDIAGLARYLEPARDYAFRFQAIQTLYDRYLIHHGGQRFELPQAFFLRVAMGLALAGNRSGALDPYLLRPVVHL